MAVLATMGSAALLVLLRDEVDNSVVALALAAAVSLCGALGGWRAGVAAALAAATSFNFLFTRPYLSLRIHDADDVLTTGTLLVVGAIAGITSSVAHRRQERVVATHHELTAVERIADLVAIGSEPADVETAVRAELLGLLALSACSFEVSVRDGMPTLGRGGVLSTSIHVYHDGGFELPAGGFAIPVIERGRSIGFLSCRPTPGVAIPVARRRTAVTLADLLGMSYTASSSGHPARRN